MGRKELDQGRDALPRYIYPTEPLGTTSIVRPRPYQIEYTFPRNDVVFPIVGAVRDPAASVDKNISSAVSCPRRKGLS
jgi:hypothetical protein